MNTPQYNYFINNEPNFSTLKIWENDQIDGEFITHKDRGNSPDMFFKPIDGQDSETDYLDALKEDQFEQNIQFSYF